jgi:PAS domain S-box-containing protein
MPNPPFPRAVRVCFRLAWKAASSFPARPRFLTHFRSLLAGGGKALLILGCLSLAAGAEDPAGSVQVPLTVEERAFLHDRTIRLGVDASRPPFESVDARGTYSGISASFLQECARRLGLRTRIVPGLTVAQALDKMALGEIDVIPKASITAERGKRLLFTEPYDTAPSVIACRKDAKFIGGLEDLAGMRIGVLKGLMIEEVLQRDHPELPLTAITNIEDGLTQLSRGKIDVFIDSLESITYMVDRLGLTNLKIAAPTPYINNMAFGVRKDLPLLQSALDKALASMSTRERTAIKNQWLGSEAQRGVPWTAWAPYVGAVGLLALFLLVRNHYLHKAMRERGQIQAELETHTRLLEEQAQIKSQLTVLSAGLQRARSLPELAQVCFAQVAPLTGIASGALHVLDERDGPLRFAGGYGRTGHDALSGPVVLGHGLVGQCAQSGEAIELTDPRGLPFTAATGYGELLLHALLVLPIQRMTGVLGVLTLASPTRFDPEQRRLLDEVLPILALNLEILAGSLETQQLLDQSRVQAQILAESERKSRAILDTLSVGMLLIDPRRGVVMDTNPVALQLSGCTRETLLGQPCRTAGCTRPLRKCPALDLGGRIEQIEEVVIHAAGQETPVLKNVVPVVLGSQTFLLESFVDISAQKELESRLRESGERLEADIAERMRLEEELRERLDELERFSRLTVDRELRMIELKKEINALMLGAGRPAPYIVED